MMFLVLVDSELITLMHEFGSSPRAGGLLFSHKKA
jgi:hypothetical protein